MPIHLEDAAKIPKDFCVFFCWQDHLDPKLHRFLIRDALNAAIGRLQNELPTGVDCVIRLDSDTMNRAGSVEIANTILEKINSSTVVIGDVTPVVVDADKERYYPNPNVMIEIGYAARAIGWNRIVCLVNRAVCKPEQLPFDIRHRRITSYLCRDSSEQTQARKELEGVLFTSLRALIQELARGEFDPTLGDAHLRHQRDLRLLKQLMATIHRGTLDWYIERGLSNHLHYDCIFFWLGFDRVVNSSHFRFYDKILEERAIYLHRVWNDTMHYGSIVFFPGHTRDSFVLLPEDRWTQEYLEDVKAMEAAYDALPGALKSFLDHVHHAFPEIDMDLTDSEAWDTNLPYITGSAVKKRKITSTRKKQRG